MNNKRLSLVFSTILLPMLFTGCSVPTTPLATPPATSLIPTQTSLAVSPDPATPGATVTLTATITATPITTNSAVGFYDAGALIGTGTIPASQPGVAAVATLTVNNFAANSSHTLTASYLGDQTHAKSVSAAVPLVIGGATAPSSINAHASFSFASSNQTISGFGAAEAFDLTYLDAHPYQSEMYKALFDPNAGLGLTYLRVQNLYRGTPGASFDPDTPKIVAAANTAHGSPLTLLMSSWSPPASLKSNGTTSGCTGSTNGVCTSGIGTLSQANGSYDYNGFAQYWADSLSAYAANGVSPAYISIQNEPDFTPTYTGMRLNPTEAPYSGTSYAGYGLAFDAVYKKLQLAPNAPMMVGPETLGIGQSFFDTAAAIPANEAAVYAHHMYSVGSGSVSNAGVVTAGGSPDGNVTNLAKLATTYPTAQKWVTEYYDTPGFYNAWTINDALTIGNDNAYIFWQAVWPSTLTTAKDQGGDQAGLLYADNPYTPASWTFTHGWTYNDAYYALKHFSYFVRPGFVRYNAAIDNADERISVFQSTDKKTTVIVALNTSATATDGLSLDLSSVTYANTAIYRSTFSTPILSGERFSSLGAYIAPSGTGSSNNSGGINLPPQSVVTIVLTN